MVVYLKRQAGGQRDQKTGDRREKQPTAVVGASEQQTSSRECVLEVAGRVSRRP